MITACHIIINKPAGAPAMTSSAAQRNMISLSDLLWTSLSIPSSSSTNDMVDISQIVRGMRLIRNGKTRSDSANDMFVKAMLGKARKQYIQAVSVCSQMESLNLKIP